MVEWKSLLNLIVHTKGPDVPRWKELQEMALKLVGSQQLAEELPELPELPVRQRRRFDRSGRWGGAMS